MRVLLVNAWHDANRGDSALVAGAIETVRRRWPGAEIRLLSMIPSTSPLWPEAYLDTAKAYPEVRILPSDLPLAASDMLSPRAILQALRLTGALLLPLRLTRQFAPSRAHLDGVDLVVSVGGHYFFTVDASTKSTLRLLRLCWPLLLARRMGIPYVLLSHSLGPYLTASAQRLIREVLSGAEGVLVREELSAATALSLAPDARVRQVPDSGFLLAKRAGDKAVPAGLPPRFVTFTLREPMKGAVEHRSRVRAAYLRGMVEVARRIRQEWPGLGIVVVPHVIGPTALEDDRPIARAFVELAGRDSGVQLYDHARDIEDLLSLYAASALVVGTRFHSVVFSISMGTPAVAVAYFGPKAAGIMKMLGMAERCFDMESIDPDAMLRIIRDALGSDARAAVVEVAARMEADAARALDLVREGQ